MLVSQKSKALGAKEEEKKENSHMSDVPPSKFPELNKEEPGSLHPLLQYDPDAAKWIKVIRAEYFEECKP